jgi:hypothetical protein
MRAAGSPRWLSAPARPMIPEASWNGSTRVISSGSQVAAMPAAIATASQFRRSQAGRRTFN